MPLTRTCRISEKEFTITDQEIALLEKLAPVIGGEKFEIPLPTLCPEERKIQRLAWRNEKKLYKRKCDFTQQEIISIFPPTAKNPIYSVSTWNSDVWDAKSYKKEYDSSRSFFEQFGELMSTVPLPGASIGPGVENSEYSGACSYIKNCYLSFSIQDAENVHYSVDIVGCKNSIDCLGAMNLENGYECVEVYDSYNVMFSYNVKNSGNSRFLLECDGCQDCYGCFGLVNASYHIYNTSYSAEEYNKKLVELLSLPLSEQKKKFESFYREKYKKTPLPNTGSENVVESINVINSKNVFFSRHIRGSEDIMHCQKIQVPKADLCIDSTSIGNNVSRIYSSYQGFHNAHNIYFCAGCYTDVSNLFYSAYCRNGANNCFGCAGLRHGESYCIFNKQYTKEEYELLVPKIIEKMIEDQEWGEFFSAHLSPLGYDDTVCQILSPMTEEEAKKKGCNWSGYESPFPEALKTIPADMLPEGIHDIPDDVLNWAIVCEVSKKPFRIIRQELEFYRKHQLPIPRKHPDERYKGRLKWNINY